MRRATVFRLFAQAALAAVLVTLTVGLLHFDQWSPPDAGDLDDNSAAVVFTGSFDRIDAALELLAEGKTPKLFISGVNPRAGIHLQRFLAQFGSRHPRLQELLDCCIEFGTLADTTLQNALETRCWLDRHQITDPIVLITSADHMPRALAATRHLVPDHILVPLPVRARSARSKARLDEYLKYLATLVLVRLPPRSTSSLDLYGPFRDGCP